MGYFLTTNPENAVPPNSWASPKTHTPGSPVKERGHRFYIPEIGRWASRDPIGEMAFFNRYSDGKTKSQRRILLRKSLCPIYVFAENSSVGVIDFLGLYGEGPPYCPDLIEKCSDVLACGISNSRIAAALYERAKAEAEARYPGRGHRDVGDAWRHCYWSCEMARTVGARCARIIGENHEACGDRHGQPSNENRMDSHNNAVGRRYALMRGSCADLCANGPAENP